MKKLHTISALLGVIAILALGCAVTVNGSGLHAVVGGSYYGHADENREKETSENQEKAKGKSRSNTYAARTWGTAALKGTITASEETISIKGKGISATMGATLGKDIVRDALGAALRATPTGAALTAGKALLGEKAERPVSVPIPPNERIKLQPIDGDD